MSNKTVTLEHTQREGDYLSKRKYFEMLSLYLDSECLNDDRLRLLEKSSRLAVNTGPFYQG